MTHGHYINGSPSPTWISWNHMKDRCTNKKHVKYSLYGGRGIKFDPSWNRFENFLADMGVRPDGKTLNRIDPDGNYTVLNCNWADIKAQNKNRRNFIRTKVKK